MDRRLAQEMPRAPPEHPLERQVPLQPGPLVPVGQPTAPGQARWQRETREVQAEPVPLEPIARRPKEVVQRAIAQAPPQVQTRIRPAQLAMARRLQARRTAAGARATAVQVQPPADRARTALVRAALLVPAAAARAAAPAGRPAITAVPEARARRERQVAAQGVAPRAVRAVLALDPSLPWERVQAATTRMARTLRVAQMQQAAAPVVQTQAARKAARVAVPV